MAVASCSDIFDRLDRELWLITAQAGERRSGLVATYVSKVSLVPLLPRVTVALAKHHFTHELIEASDAFCMHLISEGQIEWVWRFGIPTGRELDKFCGLATSMGASGAPILTGAMAWMDCRVEARMNIGDRTVFLAEVVDGRLESTEAPLMLKRLLELAPAERLRQIKLDMNQDIEVDRAAILEWRNRAGTRSKERK